MANVNYAQTKYNYDGAYLTGIQGVNTGIVVPWGSASIPSGFLLCDGSAVSRTTYAALFAVISTTYGAGDGTTTFNVPDLQDRTTVGASVANSKSLAQAIGANTVVPTGNIAGSTGSTTLTTTQIPSHSHGVLSMPSDGAGAYSLVMSVASNNQFQQSQTTGGGQSHNHTLSANFTGSANSVIQPSLVFNYIIKT